MLKILKLNRIIMFLILVFPWVIKYVIKFEDFNNTRIFAVLGFIILFIWFGLLNQELMKRVSKKLELSDTLFYIHLFLFFTAMSLFYIFSEPGVVYNFTGFYVIPFFYFFYAVFQIFNHLSKVLTYVEEDRKVEFSKRVGEIVLFFFYFIGIWWLQPRIIRALEKEDVIIKKYIKISDRDLMNNSERVNKTE